MSVAALVRDMAAMGCPIEAIVRAVEEVEARDNAAAEKRAQVAERKRRQRERDSHATVTGQSQDIPVTPPSLDKETSPRPPKEINPNPVCEAPARGKSIFALPSHIPSEEWNGYVDMRRSIRKPMTDRAKSLAVRELDKLAADGWPPGEILNHCTMNSYQGIFPPKDQRNGHRDRPANDRNEITNPITRAAAANRVARSLRPGDERSGSSALWGEG